jgi:hypothetical protein
MRTLNDPELNQLARELKHLEWVDPLSNDEEQYAQGATGQLYDQSAKSGVAQSKRRLVHPLPGLGGWTVRLYLGGGQRTLGIVDHDDISRALRYADMALMHFWKYKLRGAAPPNKFSVNFDMRRLETDMANEEHALDLLRRQEQHLLSIGVLKTSEERGADEKTRRQAMRRGFLRTTVLANHIEVVDRLGGLFEEFEKKSFQLEKWFRLIQQADGHACKTATQRHEDLILPLVEIAKLAQAQATESERRHIDMMARIDRLDRSLTSVLTALLNKPVYTPSPILPSTPDNPGVTPGIGWPLPPQITCSTTTEPKA